MNQALFSVIIPAHNEANVISRTLESIGAGSSGSECEIIVVCNGCVDGTADVVRAFDSVYVVETDTASKTHALNLGDAAATGLSRIYVDADIAISFHDLKLLVARLEDPNILAVTPNIRMDYTNSSWFVQAYYRVWLQLPYLRNGFMGSGIYALSKQGRSRFKDFPDVISDDGFVSSRFEDREVVRLEDAISNVVAPKSLKDLLIIKTRSRLGQYQLGEKYPGIALNKKNYTRLDVVSVLLRGRNIIPTIIYVYVNIVCRLRAKSRLRRQSAYVWESDRSSRQ